MIHLRASGVREGTAELRLLAGSDRLALAGRIPTMGLHRHAAPAVVVGIDGPLRFALDGATRDCRAALLVPSFWHTVDAFGGRMAVFLLPPLTAKKSQLTELPFAGDWAALGGALLQRDRGVLDSVEDLLVKAQLDLRPPDDRIRRALAAFSAQLDENLSVDEAARAAHLSPSRLMATVREQIGVPLRRYRSWLRTFQVARDYGEGASLTRAALAAGFSSSAHLYAASREYFGLCPSQVLSPGMRADIVSV